MMPKSNPAGIFWTHHMSGFKGRVKTHVTKYATVLPVGRLITPFSSPPTYCQWLSLLLTEVDTFWWCAKNMSVMPSPLHADTDDILPYIFIPSRL